MFAFAEKRPIVFEIILLVVAFLVAGIFTFIGNIFNNHPDLSSSVGRIVAFILLAIVFKRTFLKDSPFTNLVILVPALAFPIWNVFYNLSSGATIGGTPFFVEGAITAIAPALFEEILFRVIFIYYLKKNGKRDMECLFITAAVFALIHLTNILSGNVIGVAIQLVYSFVIGLVLAAIYLKNGSFIQIVFLHFLIDFTNRLYINPASTASYVQLGIFAVLLLGEVFYAVRLTTAQTK